MRRIFAAGCLLLPVAVSAQDRLGPAFRVNTYSTGIQARPSVAMAADGRFVVSWIDHRQGVGYNVFARRFGASGQSAEAEFVVGTEPIAHRYGAPLSASATPSGAFIVAWDEPAGSRAQTCDASGALAGPPIVWPRRYPAAAALSEGAFVITAVGTDADTGGIVARRFDAGGVPTAPDFAVNTITTSYQGYPVVAGEPSGRFVVAWATLTFQMPGLDDVFLRRYDAAGMPLGPDVAVNTHTTGYQRKAAAAMDADGNAVVVWEDDSIGLDSRTDFADIYAQRYDAAGAPVGANFRVNSTAAGVQRDPAVAYDANGTFLVAWQGGADVVARRFDASGLPMGDDFLVKAESTPTQRFPRVAGAGAGRFVVVWQDSLGGASPSAPDVFAQLYRDDNVIFDDNFDSGGYAAWSGYATGAGPLEVSTWPMFGAEGSALAASVTGVGGSYVQDDTPADEAEYHARFHFDPNQFDPGEADGHLRMRLFIGLQAAPNRRLFAIVLRRVAGAHALMARARLDDNTQADTDFVPISDEPHTVEIAWKRASGPDAGDGSLELWIDGASVSMMAGLDNAGSAVDFVRLGALSVKSAAEGTLHWDEFKSRREGYIGP